jgi:hypothetical protein
MARQMREAFSAGNWSHGSHFLSGPLAIEEHGK